MKFSWSHLHFHKKIYEFAKLRVIRAMSARVVYLPMCQSAKRVPISHFLRTNVPINVLTCQRSANYSTWCPKMPKANQIFNFACQKAYQFFKRILHFLNFYNDAQHFQNLKNLWTILENLSRETPISLTPLTSFSMEHVGFTKQLFG